MRCKYCNSPIKFKDTEMGLRMFDANGRPHYCLSKRPVERFINNYSHNKICPHGILKTHACDLCTEMRYGSY